jgi:hypothetical protein
MKKKKRHISVLNRNHGTDKWETAHVAMYWLKLEMDREK